MKRVPAVHAAVALGLAAIGVGCDFPTDVPILEQSWVIEMDGTTIGVAELLPADVAVSGSSFDVTVPQVQTSQSLGNLCPECAALNGFTAPVPAFADSFDVNQGLPGDVTAATVTSGAIDITLTNGFSFDPLENGGTITIRVRDQAGGTLLGSVTWDGGAGDVLTPGGGTSTKVLTLAPGAIGSTLLVRTVVDAPGGQTAQINTAETITMEANPTSLLVSDATVNVVDKTVNFGPEPLDTEDVPSELADNIESGSIVLTVTNPFGVSLSGNLDIGTTSKTLNIGSQASSTVPLTYTGPELQSILGEPGVTFGGGGTATATGGVVVTPISEIVLETTVAFTVLVGN